MTIDAQKLALDRQRLALELQRLRLERRKTAIEVCRARREHRFVLRNSAALIAGSISLLSLVITGYGLVNNYRAQQRDIQLSAEREQRASDESARKWRIDATNFIATHKDAILSPEIGDQLQLRSIMLLSFPREIVDTLFARLKAQAADASSARVWEEGRRLIDQQNLGEAAVPDIDAGAPQQVPAAAPNARDLALQLNGPSRRAVSNALVARYAHDRAATIALLADTLQPDQETTSYRVNLYVLFTLARIGGGWVGTKDQRAKIEAQAAGPHAVDPTFRRWAAQALSAYRER